MNAIKIIKPYKPIRREELLIPERAWNAALTWSDCQKLAIERLQFAYPDMKFPTKLDFVRILNPTIIDSPWRRVTVEFNPNDCK